jgi:hypothetical protein
MVDTFIEHDDETLDPPRTDSATTADGVDNTFLFRGDSARDAVPAVFRVILAEDSRANQMAISRLLKAQAGAYTRRLFSCT